MILTAEKQSVELADLLVNNTQIPHQYFEFGSLFLLNVSSSEDAIQEYAFYKKDESSECYYKFESVTVSWCKKEIIQSNLETWDQQNIDDMKSIMSDVPLKEARREFIDHIIPFRQMELFKQAFEKFKQAY